MLETITDILNKLRKDDVKNVFVHWREKCQWVADHNGKFDPNERKASSFDIVSLDLSP
jgi:hypothetical protein